MIIINYQLKLNKNDITLLNKYITFGIENISNSILLFKSNIDVFTKELLISINMVKSKRRFFYIFFIGMIIFYN